jgi:hypothetical protein
LRQRPFGAQGVVVRVYGASEGSEKGAQKGDVGGGEIAAHGGNAAAAAA